MSRLIRGPGAVLFARALPSAVVADGAASPSASTATATASAPAPASGRKFRVKYRSLSNVYLEGGRAQGLEVGDRLQVVDGKTTVAELEVVYAAEQSASCKPIQETRPIREGDVAVLTKKAPGSTPAATPPKAEQDTARPATLSAPASAAGTTYSERRANAPWARLRGGASFGYYRVWDHTESGYSFEERTGRLDLGLYDIGGQPLSFTLRGRSRQDSRARTLSSRTPMDEGTDRLYEVALRYEPSSDNVTVEIGRVGIDRFVGIGYLDGGILRLRVLPGVQLGAFGGRIADIEAFGFGGSGRRLGGFLRLSPGGRYVIGGYDATLAFVREDANGDVSRQYLSLESRFGGRSRLTLFERAELDLNTGWRRELTGKSTQLSNVSLSANLRMSPSAFAFVSYDGRRNYRYFQNRDVPEEVFDDLLHQGLRAGIGVSRPGGFGATFGFGMSLKEQDPRHPELNLANAYSFNGGVRHANLFSSGFSVGVDGSGFSNGYTKGGLVSARLGRSLRGGHLLDLSYTLTRYRVEQTQEDRQTHWLRLLGRAQLGRRLYLQADLENDSGDDLKGPRGMLELGLVF